MKKLFLIIIFILLPKPAYATNTELVDLKNISLEKEYSEHEYFDINKLPDNVFYRLSTDCKYIFNNKNNLIVKNLESSKKIFYIVINGNVIPLGNEDYNPRTDASAYIIKDRDKFYLLIDKMHEYDSRFYSLYIIVNNKIEIVEECSGRIDFVGYDYIIGYTDLGMIGYQRCEFKKVFRNGKLELDGEYKVIGIEDSSPAYPIWKYYTLVKDLKYEEYNDKTKKYQEKVLKTGTKIRSLSTDAKTYITIEVEDGRKGNVKVDKVDDEFGRDFIVNGQLFMNYYFLDGTKYSIEVFSPMAAY